MSFIITLVCFLIERFFDWSHLRHWHWFIKYITWVNLKFGRFSSYFILAICVLPAVLIVGLISCLLTGILFDLFKIIFGILIVMYCLGPLNFWAQVYACLTCSDPKEVNDKLQKLFGFDIMPEGDNFHRSVTSAIFIAANRRLFAVFFWFLVLGPAGAMLYRCTDWCRVRGLSMTLAAKQFEDLLDWLPVRFFSLLFALGGHFTRVLGRLKQYVFAPPALNEILLSNCGMAALDAADNPTFPEGAAEKEAVSLLDRVFVIGLVILALTVLV